jgi:hypothetical protein
MKTLKLNVLKKNRKYFKCKIGTSDCRLKIDENSEKLELGEQDLLVNDVSIRSKYGTDLIFELAVDAEKQSKSKRLISLKSKYNKYLIKRCKDLGGRWCSDSESWFFSEIVEKEVEELDEVFNSDKVVVEITATDDCYADTGPLKFRGIILASARGRDSGAKLGDEIAAVSGGVGSGGSMKNWITRAYEDTVFRFEIPKKVLEIDEKELDKGNWKKIEVVG